jgi:hypothetical protein
VTAALGFGLELVSQGGQDAGLVFGLGGQQDRGPHGLLVQDRPEAGRDVQGVQAQVVRFPARAEGGGQVAVAGPVDLLDPGAQPGDGFGSCVGQQVPPLRCRFGLVAVGVGGVDGGGGELGEGGGVFVQGAVEPSDLLVVGGELVQDRGDRVVAGHGQFHRKVPVGT